MDVLYTTAGATRTLRYNETAMSTAALRWDVTPEEAVALQRELADRVIRRNELGPVEWIAGADVHYPQRDTARAVALLMRYPELELAEHAVVEEPVTFPYVPGLLSFREAPAVLHAMERLSRRPDLVLVDGQGIAHPRRLGIGAHLGLILDLPAIGAAKSRLFGHAPEPGPQAGSWEPLMAGSEVVGAVLRSRTAVKPLYVSIGHRVDLETAVHWVLSCCRGYRIPEPLRIAHRIAGEYRNRGTAEQRSAGPHHQAGAARQKRSHENP